MLETSVIQTSGPMSIPKVLAYSFASSKKCRPKWSEDPTKMTLGFLILMPDLSEMKFMAIFAKSRRVGLIEKTKGYLDALANWEGKELIRVGIRSWWK